MTTQNKELKKRYKMETLNLDRNRMTYYGLSINARINAKYNLNAFADIEPCELLEFSLFNQMISPLFYETLLTEL